MLGRKKVCFTIIGFFLFSLLFSTLQMNFEKDVINENKTLNLSANLEGAENLLITNIYREVNISAYGVMNILDRITIQNKNSNPITSVFVSVPNQLSDHLIFFKATSEGDKSLLYERSYMIMNEYEMIAIYLDTPLLPQRSVILYSFQIYKDSFNFALVETEPNNWEQFINFTVYTFPTLPYKALGVIITDVKFHENSEITYWEKIGDMGVKHQIENKYSYELHDHPELNHLDPFLENFDATQKKISFTFKDSRTKLEINQIERDIYISTWGIIRINEDFIIENLGVKQIERITLYAPVNSKNIRVYDQIGELSINLDESNSNSKEIEIHFSQNRAPITPDSKFRFYLEYYLPTENHISLNWFQESVQIDLLTTKYEFIGRNQKINIIIDGCNNLEFISTTPNAILGSGASKILKFNSEYVTPFEEKVIQFTFSIDIFDMILRPIIIILVISFLGTLYVLFIKTKKIGKDLDIIEREILPVNEIREFCSLYEEKNALILEIRRAEEEVKRKKINKKVYNNLLSKNSAKIEQIKMEIIPFKKELSKSSEIFENIIKKLDVLDAERISVNDSINLLENRYKRGKLPSKAAYQRLLEDFMRRRRKIDKTIDKNVQQLRTYLL